MGHSKWLSIASVAVVVLVAVSLVFKEWAKPGAQQKLDGTRSEVAGQQPKAAPLDKGSPVAGSPRGLWVQGENGEWEAIDELQPGLAGPGGTHDEDRPVEMSQLSWKRRMDSGAFSQAILQYAAGRRGTIPETDAFGLSIEFSYDGETGTVPVNREGEHTFFPDGVVVLSASAERACDLSVFRITANGTSIEKTLLYSTHEGENPPLIAGSSRQVFEFSPEPIGTPSFFYAIATLTQPETKPNELASQQRASERFLPYRVQPALKDKIASLEKQGRGRLNPFQYAFELATLRTSDEDLPVAITSWEQVREIVQKARGEKNSDFADVTHWLEHTQNLTRLTTKQYTSVREAERLLKHQMESPSSVRQASEVFESLLPAEDARVRELRLKRAVVALEAGGRFDDFLTTCEELLSVHRNRSGESARGAIAVLEKLADAHVVYGSLKTARDLYFEALNAHLEWYGREHAETVDVYSRLMDVASRLDAPQEVRWHRDTLIKLRSRLDPSHRNVARETAKQCIDRIRAGDFEAPTLNLRSALPYLIDGKLEAQLALVTAYPWIKRSDFDSDAAAKEICQQALERAELKHPNSPQMCRPLRMQARFLADAGKADEALELAQQAIGIRKDRGAMPRGGDYAALAYVYRLSGEEKLCLDAHRESLRLHKIREQDYSPLDESKLMLEYAQSLYRFGKYEEAARQSEIALRFEAELFRSIAMHLDNAHGMSIAAGLKRTLGIVLSHLERVEEKRAERAFNAVWQVSGLLSRAIAQRRALALERPELRKRWEAYVKLREKLAKTYGTQGAGLTRDRERSERTLLRNSPYTSVGLSEQTLEEMLERRGEARTAIVEFVRTERATAASEQLMPVYDAFIVRKIEAGAPKIEWEVLGFAEGIDQQVRIWQEPLKVAGRGVGKAPAKRRLSSFAAPKKLYSRTWAKLVDHLDGCDTVVLCPDGDLHHVPWAAMPGKAPKTYSAHDYRMVMAANAREFLTREQASGNESGNLLLVGDVDFGAKAGQQRPGEDWEKLPGTRAEVDAIAKLAAKTEIRLTEVLNENATEGRVVDSIGLGARFIHLATHGEVAAMDPWDNQLGPAAVARARNPLRDVCLLLAGSNLPPDIGPSGLIGHDARLTGAEIEVMDLRTTRLVVLSACETVLGPVRTGEGVFGLQRAFLMSGVETVVASLWKVDDVATAHLMELFYRNLWVSKLGRSESLREAQLQLIAEGYPPSVWAAWALAGRL